MRLLKCGAGGLIGVQPLAELRQALGPLPLQGIAPMDQHLDQSRAHLRATYGSLYDRLIQILYIADIMTISYFAKDEYEPEVTTILPRLPQATSAAEVERILREEFAYWFYEGLSLDPERFAWAARTIWQMWRAYGLAAEQSPCRKALVALWWAVKLHCIALVTPIYKPRVFWVDA